MPMLLSRTPAKAVFLLSALAMVWFLPYLVPVSPSIALSYVVGYNNRAALLLFYVLAVGFALLTRGRMARQTDSRDQGASRLDLWLGLVLVLLLLFLRHHHAQLPKGESSYALDRLQMLAQGLRPYTGFEYIYGPFHLWFPSLLARLSHQTVVNGYYAWWYIQWLLGVVMLWATVRMLPFALSRRRWIFWAVLVPELPYILAEGTAYTPLRMAGAAFAVLVVTRGGRGRPAALFALSAAAVLLAFGISPEQGMAVGVGLLAWLALRAGRERTASTLWVTAGLACVLVLTVAWSARLGLFLGLREFAGGAYFFPLVPSAAVATLLLAYVAAACAGVRAWRAGDLAGPAIPMALCGFAALPAAFGRCDLGHLQMGSAALFLGIAVIESSPAVRRFWTPLILLSLVGLPYLAGIRMVIRKVQSGTAVGNHSTREYLETGGLGGPVPAGTIVLEAPCPVVYKVPTIWPPFNQTPAQACLDPGFYAGMLDVLTRETIGRKVDELTREPRGPLLLRSVPLDEEFAQEATETSTGPLRGLEQALWLPPLRNKPLDYRPVIRAIEDDYVPGPVAGGYRVWTPKEP